jgi:hypothetical protein
MSNNNYFTDADTYISASGADVHARRARKILDGWGGRFRNSFKEISQGDWEKSAEFAGSPSISQVERAFWESADAFITDKAPMLTGFCLGFQMLKKTEDDSRVCGIFAYRVGDELVYIPVFMINGEILGHELLYIVSRDQFVPSDEKWVNYLLSRKPIEPGKVELRERSEIPASTGYSRLRMGQGVKFSSYEECPRLSDELTLLALRTMFKTAASNINPLDTIPWKIAVSNFDLDELFQRSRKATKLAELWCNKYPIYGRLMDYIRDGRGLNDHLTMWEKKAEVAKQLGIRPRVKPTLQEYLKSQMPKTAEAPKPGKVAVYLPEQIPLHQYRLLPTELIDKIHRDGYYVVDTRDQTKLASVPAGGEGGICNPVHPGLYHVFMSDGTFKPCFVLKDFNPDYDHVPVCSDSSNNENSYSMHPQGGKYIVLCSKTGRHTHAYRGDIWVAERNPDEDWFSKLPESNTDLNTYDDLRGDPRSCLNRCDCTSGPKTLDSWDRHRDITSFLIAPSGVAYRGRIEKDGDNTYYDFSESLPINLFSDRMSGFKIVTGEDHSRYDCKSKCVFGPKKAVLRRYKDIDDDKGLHLGNRVLWMTLLMEGTSSIKTQRYPGSFNEYIIDNTSTKSKTAALKYLMTEHFLSQKTAEAILQEADACYPKAVTTMREKVAFMGEMPRDKISVTFPNKEKTTHDVTGMEVEEDLNTEEPVEQLRATREPTDDDLWPGLLSSETDQINSAPAPNTEDMQLASQAAQAGQKDFVSSQMLMSLLREIDDDGIINKYIVTFEKACDTLGRLYMQVLWRTDAFEERFGRSQLKEFREMLVSLFQQMGDFICYLRQRDIRPSPVLTLDSADADTAENN